MTRRTRGIVIVAVVALVIVPGLAIARFADSQADGRASRVADQVLTDTKGLTKEQVAVFGGRLAIAGFGGDSRRVLVDLFPSLKANYESSEFNHGMLSVTLSTGWAWAHRCVYVLLGGPSPRIDTTSQASCSMRPIV